MGCRVKIILELRKNLTKKHSHKLFKLFQIIPTPTYLAGSWTLLLGLEGLDWLGPESQDLALRLYCFDWVSRVLKFRVL